MNSRRTTSAAKRTASGLKRKPNNEDINLANYDPLKNSIDRMKHNNGNLLKLSWLF